MYKMNACIVLYLVSNHNKFINRIHFVFFIQVVSCSARLFVDRMVLFMSLPRS